MKRHLKSALQLGFDLVNIFTALLLTKLFNIIIIIDFKNTYLSTI